jgi:hypothetical protein
MRRWGLGLSAKLVKSLAFSSIVGGICRRKRVAAFSGKCIDCYRCVRFAALIFFATAQKVPTFSQNMDSL